MMDDATQKLVDEARKRADFEAREDHGIAVLLRDMADALEAAQRPPVELAKSPEDIAAEYAPFDGSDPDTVIHVRGLIAAAIREDRTQRPPVSPEVRDELVAHIHARAEFDSDECDHGTYTGGALHGQPYRMCERKADALLARFSLPVLDVERLTRWLVENRRLVAGSAWEYVDSEGTASALVAALPALTQDGRSSDSERSGPEVDRLRARVRELEAQREAVLALHAPEERAHDGSGEWSVPLAEWDDETRSPETFTICSHCGSIEMRESQGESESAVYLEALWPCSTVWALTERSTT